MSNRQTMSASAGPSSTGFAPDGTMNDASAVKGPSLPSAIPSASRQRASQRFVTTKTRSPSIVADEQMPSFIASKSSLTLERSISSLGTTSRHSRRPDRSSKHSSTPPSVVANRGSSISSSLVPTNTRPPATTGLE